MNSNSERQKINYPKKEIFLVCLVVFAIIMTYSLLSSGRFVYIMGDSMEPTLKNGDLVFFKKATSIERGDIVVFETPKEWRRKEETLVKRVIGLPGDKIKIVNNTLFVNDIERLTIPKKYQPTEDIEFSICTGCFFVVGDNQEKSIDSLFFTIAGRDPTALIPLESIKYSEKFQK